MSAARHYDVCTCFIWGRSTPAHPSPRTAAIITPNMIWDDARMNRGRASFLHLLFRPFISILPFFYVAIHFTLSLHYLCHSITRSTYVIRFVASFADFFHIYPLPALCSLHCSLHSLRSLHSLHSPTLHDFPFFHPFIPLH